MLRKLDFFARTPNPIRFGDPANPDTKDSQKTPCGGFIVILYMLAGVGYIGISI